jgi:diguanylate cyclase (GGDEF)-like protein/putative nucleotidyltransferase with HDIG domain
VASVRRLSRLGVLYASLVTSCGIVAIGHSLLRAYQAPPHADWLLLAVLTLISGSASVNLPGAHVSISISEAFVFTAVLLYGPAAGTLTVAIDSLVISFWIARRRPELIRALFNISAPIFSAWASAHLFFYVSGIAPLVNGAASLNKILPSLILFAIVYFGLNSSLIAGVVAFEKHQSPLEIWRKEFVWLSLNYFCGASVAVLLVGNNRSIDLRFVGLMMPLLLVLYFTFKTSMDRVEDAKRHVEKLNALYLSTIETLAMAIDAKDQITHGHIRRVQAYAIGLAKTVGIADDKMIKAIEAAALLHDMGKLAVPEYILNKPGKLTAAEFEKMKLHASVGADILAAIDFPYPVVPIVRHHHENWDGTGYPAGLAGTEIPIGARILSVVDCFDALTSDRPYRPRLSDEEALRVVVQRRGTMYDPLVVDTFVKVHRDIRPESSKSRSEFSQNTLKELASSSAAALTDSTRFEEITAGSDEMLTLFDLARALAGQSSVSGVGDTVAKHVRRLLPFSLFVVYSYDTTADELNAVYAMGEAAQMVKGLRITLGQRVSGWVAASRQTIANSDATLDLGELARSESRLRSCLSTPLLSSDRLLGVLTLYSSSVSGFTDNHKRLIEAVSRQVGHAFGSITDATTEIRRDSASTLQSLRQLETFLESQFGEQPSNRRDFTLLVVDIPTLPQVESLYGKRIASDVVADVAAHIRVAVRAEDLVCGNENGGLIVLLDNQTEQSATRLADEISSRVKAGRFMLPSGELLPVGVAVTRVSNPRNMAEFRDWVGALRVHGQTVRKSGVSIVH